MDTHVKIAVVKPEVTIVPPETDAISKVARMARICYRSEKAAGPEADDRLVRSCIKRGHTSVNEHSFISVLLTRNKTIEVEDFGINLKQQAKITPYDLWTMIDTPNKRQYLTEIFDDQFYKEVAPQSPTPRSYRVIAGNFRAWLNFLDESTAASITKGEPIFVALNMAIVMVLYKKYPTVFQAFIDKCNDAFSRCKPDHFLRTWFLKGILADKNPDSIPLTCEYFERFIGTFGLYANQTTPKFTLSSIWKISRSVSHEIVRHRTCAFSQESQRYVNYDGKGFEFIHPSMDPIKFKDYSLKEFDYQNIDDQGEPAETGAKIKLLFQGYIPENTTIFHHWKQSAQNAADEYAQLMEDGLFKDDTSEKLELPPEFCRGTLNNDTATTIGITWTPSGFLNTMKWRLDDPAFWPIRRQIGEMLIVGLKDKHPFFENFDPALIMKWLDKNVRFGIMQTREADPAVASLYAYQEQRAKEAHELTMQHHQLIQKQAEEAAKRAAEQAQKK